MARPERFRINRPDVIHEVLDGELVIVNLRSGAYYSLDPVGAAIWQEIERGSSEAEIVVDALARFEGEAGEVESAVRGLVEELRGENLIAPTDAPAAALPSQACDGRTPFRAPRLQKYTDMQELLLLDPIHEVDESGWPTRGT